MPSSKEHTSATPRPTRSIAETIQQGGFALYNEGTDTDVLDVLDQYCVYDIGTISQAGTFILPPNKLAPSLTHKHDGLTGQLSALLTSLKDRNVTGNVNVMIPVADYGHWRLAIIEIANWQITAAKLWDPMGPALKGDDAARDAMVSAVGTAAAEHQQRAWPEPVVEKASVQTGSTTCMDHVLKKAYQESNIQNSLTRAEDDTKLRRAVIETIVQKNRLDVTSTLQESHNALSSLPPNPSQETLEGVFKTLAANPALCEDFDAIFARRLQNLYDDRKNDHQQERKLVSQARQDALQKYHTLQTSCYAAFFQAQHQQPLQAAPTPTSCRQEASEVADPTRTLTEVTA